MSPPKRFSPSRLIALRERAGLTRTQLAFYCDVTEQTVYAWERGKTRASKPNEPRGGALARIVSTLNCSLDDLFEVDTEHDPAGKSEVAR